jgi:hypothetical protein
LLIRQPVRATFVVSPRMMPRQAEQLADEIRERLGLPGGIAMPGDD